MLKKYKGMLAFNLFEMIKGNKVTFFGCLAMGSDIRYQLRIMQK